MVPTKQPEDDDGSETSKMGVLVPEKVQQDNRSLVLYRNNGSKRNKLGPATTDRITHGLAMYFWRHPSELEEVAQSEYVDNPEGFKQRIKQYQDKHIEDTLVVARNLLHGSLAQTESRHGDNKKSSSPDKNGHTYQTIGSKELSDNRLGGVPRIEDAPRDENIPEDVPERAAENLSTELDQLIGQKVREQVKPLDRRVSRLEKSETGSTDEQDVDDA